MYSKIALLCDSVFLEVFLQHKRRKIKITIEENPRFEQTVILRNI